MDTKIEFKINLKLSDFNINLKRVNQNLKI